MQTHRRPTHRRFASAATAVLVFALSALVVTGAVGPGARPAGADTAITIAGGGWGHAVGMSQYGAKGMADAGFSANQIVGHYYQGTTVQTLAQPNDLRVLLVEGASSTVSGASTVQWTVGASTVAWSAPGQVVNVGVSGTTITLDGNPVVTGGALNILYGGSPTTLGLSGNRYRYGYIKVTVPTAGRLRFVVEQLTMQQYLLGIGEMPSSWHTEALKAQALASRTYAKELTERRRSLDPTRTYDLAATTSDQVYVGYEKEAGVGGDRWVQAVAATDNQTITYGGAAIQAFFSSSSGGHTENSEYVFAATLPYLRGVADPYDSTAANPNFRWSRTYSGDVLGEWVRQGTGTTIGTVTNIAVLGPPGVSGRVDKATLRVTGVSGAVNLSGASFRSIVNARASSSLQLKSTLWLLDPVGNLETATGGEGTIRVKGWAIDPSTTAAVGIHVYVDNNFAGSFPADVSRPDVGSVYGGYGSNHGFDRTFPATGGSHSVCVYALNAGPGQTNSLLGCQSVVVTAANPLGSLDSISGASLSVRVRGWALDPDTTGPVSIHVYVDGAFAGALTANVDRPDVGAAYPGWGSAHGFDGAVAASPGTHTVCVFAMNVGSGSVNTQLGGCVGVAVGNGNPIGSFEAVAGLPGGFRFKGWTIDPDTPAPVTVHVYVDGGFVGAFAADKPRPDVAVVFPPYGGYHGFDALVSAVRGNHTVCVFAMNIGPGTDNPLLGCSAVYAG